MALSKVPAVALASGAARTNFGAGAVLQVVNTTSNTSHSGSGSGTVLNLTDLTTTITPSSVSSKILVMPMLAQFMVGNTAGWKLVVTRNGTQIYNPGSAYEVYQQASSGTMGDNYGRSSWAFMDSPNTTSSVTYTFSLVLYSNQAGINYGSLYRSFITVMEIAA